MKILQINLDDAMVCFQYICRALIIPHTIISSIRAADKPLLIFMFSLFALNNINPCMVGLGTTTPATVCVTLKVPTLKSETGLTGELWSNGVTFFLMDFKVFVVFLVFFLVFPDISFIFVGYILTCLYVTCHLSPEHTTIQLQLL